MLELNFKDWLEYSANPYNRTVVIGHQPDDSIAKTGIHHTGNFIQNALNKQMYDRSGVHPPHHVMDYGDKQNVKHRYSVTKQLPENYTIADVRAIKQATDQEIINWIKINDPNTFKTCDLTRRTIKTSDAGDNKVIITLNIPIKQAVGH